MTKAPPSMAPVRRVSALSSRIHRSSRLTASRTTSPARCIQKRIKANPHAGGLGNGFILFRLSAYARVKHLNGRVHREMGYYPDTIDHSGVSLDIRLHVSRSNRHFQRHAREWRRLLLNIHRQLWFVSFIIIVKESSFTNSHASAEAGQPIVDVRGVDLSISIELLKGVDGQLSVPKGPVNL